MRMAIFIVFLILIFGGLAYALWHVWQLLPLAALWRWCVVIALASSVLSMFLAFGGTLERLPVNTASVLYHISTSSIFVLLYAIMLFLLLDLLRLLHIVPSEWLHNNWYTTGAVAALLVVILGYGNLKHHKKVRVDLPLTTSKPLPKEYKIVMATDLHIGYHHRRTELARWIDLINAEHPDLVLIGGDIIDISVRPILEDRMAEEFQRLNAPVYACLGNHEYYSQQPLARAFYQEAGIHLLIDSIATVDSALCIVGRDDRTNSRRSPLKWLIDKAPKGLYTIVLDHQPYHLDDVEQLGVDFQLSGHTHRGQVWPISWITDAMYECSFGPWQRGATRYYVSSGLGIWGGKFRIGTQSEYIVATLRTTAQ